MNSDNWINFMNHYIMLLEEDINSIDNDKDRVLYPDGQKLGIIMALKDLKTCIDIYAGDNGIPDLMYDPDQLLTGRM